jgi:hypothetical protein
MATQRLSGCGERSASALAAKKEEISAKVSLTLDTQLNTK